MGGETVWTYGIGALMMAQCGAGMLELRKLKSEPDKKNFDMDAATKPGIVGGMIHATIVAFCMPATHAIFAIGGVPKPRSMSASTFLDENGSAIFVYGGVVIPVICMLLRDWYHSSNRLSKVTAITLGISSAFMSALFPVSGFPLATLGAAGMLVAKPVTVKEENNDKLIRYNYSGWRLGCVFKVAAVAQCAVTLLDGALRNAVLETFANGILIQSENPGMCSMYTRLGSSGWKWIGMHSLLTASQFWVMGSLVQDWALRADQLRPSSAYINFGANGVMSLFCLASGYWGGLAPALSMLVYERKGDSSSRKSVKNE